MAVIETTWHCYGCKQTHVSRFDERHVKDFMVTDRPRCRKRRQKMVRVRQRPFSVPSEKAVRRA